MKTVKRILALVLLAMLLLSFVGCTETGSYSDVQRTKDIANNLQDAQPTPTDLDYSLERYNLIRRTYWVNGKREKALNLPCAIDKPLGYIVLFAGNTVVQSFVVDGKVSSLNSFLTPDSEEYAASYSKWLADVDGSYGENDDGIFFFTPDGKYIEWSGEYLYSDLPFTVNNPVVSIQTKEK